MRQFIKQFIKTKNFDTTFFMIIWNFFSFNEINLPAAADANSSNTTTLLLVTLAGKKNDTIFKQSILCRAHILEQMEAVK